MVKDTHRGSVEDGGAVRQLGGAETSSSAILTLDELRQITNNFSHDQLVGEGAFGKVYKGVLTNGDMIAVKRFSSTITGIQDVQYENEAQHLMRLKHPNIVQLVGYCSETETELVEYNGKLVRAEKLERLLCLEYMPKGSLHDHLSDETSGLKWNVRYKIIEGICYGLHYLHEEWQVTPIIHMDLKPANILLDDNMVPKIADFGLSRLFGEEQTRTCTASCKGTPGYMAPEYLEKGVITKKFDIFSLGVIIIQIITGLKEYPTEETKTASHQQYINLVLNNWRHRLTKAQGYTSQDIDYQQIKNCIQIGLLCVKFDGMKRPTISQIIKMLERSDAVYQNEREAPLGEGLDRDRSMILDSVLDYLASSLTMFVSNLELAEISQHRAIKGYVNNLRNYERVALMMQKAGKVKLDGEVGRYWLKRIKDHMYQVDNVVDQWIIKNAKPKGSLRRMIGFGDHSGLMKVAAALEELNRDFESMLMLPFEAKTNQLAIRSYGKTAPDYNADIVGDYVDSDASNIIELLHSPKKKYRLIAIVGMVGIGKTTLARRIYHRVKVDDGNAQHFDTKLWICFSNDLSSLIMWSDRRTEGPAKTQLQKLGTEIANKKFLLVVDSVWTENVWEALLEGPLQQGNHENSRVIVTTRNKHIAKRIGAGYIHYVKRMNNIDALSLLFRRASVSENDEADLKDIAQQIVKKCDGLPLAVRSIGRTLRGQEPTRHDWETACRTAFQVLSPEEQYMINLSFQNLPSYMRQCFLYCSVFPEDFFIEKQYIIQQWISEGFILMSKLSMEEVAENCFHELIGRGLLHLEFGNAGVIGAKMAIMIRSFAKVVSDYENFYNSNLFEARRLFIVENNEANDHNDNDNENENGDSGEITREQNVNDDMENNNRNNNEAGRDANASESILLHGLRRMKYLRTLVLHRITVPDGFQVDTFKKLNLLRVLDLREAQGIRALPISIGSLEHLRYLNISETEIGSVPESIAYLTMLQYLLLRNCSKIHTLPKGIGKLRYLRCLDISGTAIREINWSFSGMEELISMQGFPIGDSIASLQSLDLKFPKKLDILRIDVLEEILEPPPENQWPIINYQLKELELCYINVDPTLEPKDTTDKTRQQVLDRFVPHKRLVHLKIQNYYGKQYPSWILRLSNLQQLHLQNCVLCEKLPSLGELPQLKFLAVTGFSSLCSLGIEFRGGLQCKIAFPRLEQLYIGDMRALHTWSDLQSQDLPQLHILRLSGCIKLTSIPLILQNSTTLTRLEVDARTKIGIEDKLRRFTKGTVINITDTWEPQQDEIVEALVGPPIAQPPQQDEIVEAAVAPQNERPGRIKLDLKKDMLFINAFFALLLLLFITILFVF